MSDDDYELALLPAQPLIDALPNPLEKAHVAALEDDLRRHGNQPDALIETLHTVQEAFGFLDEVSLQFVAESLRVPFSFTPCHY